MSGSGMIDPVPETMRQECAQAIAFMEGEKAGEAAGRLAERADVLAYFSRKHASAQKIADRAPHDADNARAMMRFCNVFSGDIGGGLHEGEALIWPEGMTWAESLQLEGEGGDDRFPFTLKELAMLALASGVAMWAGYQFAEAIWPA